MPVIVFSVLKLIACVSMTDDGPLILRWMEMVQIRTLNVRNKNLTPTAAAATRDAAARRRQEGDDDDGDDDCIEGFVVALSCVLVALIL